MKLAIMQPYFLPYIGYYQLIREVDTFVIYDNIQYTKKGWINRNRYLSNGKEKYFTIPLKKDSDYLDIRERSISDSFNRKKSLNALLESYRKAINFTEGKQLLTDLYSCEEENLFDFIRYSIEKTCNYLNLNTDIIISSSIEMDHSLKGEERVLATCSALGADQYINPQGGIDLYSKEQFRNNNIELGFLMADLIPYPQKSENFIPGLSIMDVIMNNSLEYIHDSLLPAYKLV